MSKRNGHYLAALGGLAALSIMSTNAVGEPIGKPSSAQSTPEQAQPQAPQPKAAEPKANCTGAKPGEDANLCYERRSSEAAEQQALESRNASNLGERNYWLGVVQSIGLITSLLLTAWAAYSAASAAKSAAKSTDIIPLLEQPYLFPLIEVDNANDALFAAAASKQSRPFILFKIKNYGKTPATLIQIFGELYVRGDNQAHNVRGDFLPKEPMLGEQGTTERFEAKATRDLNPEDFTDIHNGSRNLVFIGWIVYRDVWQRKNTVHFGWRYNPILQGWDVISG